MFNLTDLLKHLFIVLFTLTDIKYARNKIVKPHISIRNAISLPMLMDKISS